MPKLFHNRRFAAALDTRGKKQFVPNFFITTDKTQCITAAMRRTRKSLVSGFAKSAFSDGLRQIALMRTDQR